MFLQIVFLVIASLAATNHVVNYRKLKRENEQLKYWYYRLDNECCTLERANTRLQARFDNMVNLRDEASHNYNVLLAATMVNGNAANTDCPITGPM